MVARRRHRAMPAVGTVGPRRGRWVLIAVTLSAACGALAARGSGQNHAILTAVQRFMLVTHQHGGTQHSGSGHDGSQHHNVRHNAVRRQVEPR